MMRSAHRRCGPASFILLRKRLAVAPPPVPLQHRLGVDPLLVGHRVEGVHDGDVHGVDDALAGEAVGQVGLDLGHETVEVAVHQPVPQVPASSNIELPQLGPEEALVPLEVLPHPAGHDVAAVGPAEHVDDVGDAVAHRRDPVHGLERAAPQAEQPAQVGDADADGEHPVPALVELVGDGQAARRAGSRRGARRPTPARA